MKQFKHKAPSHPPLTGLALSRTKHFVSRWFNHEQPPADVININPDSVVWLDAHNRVVRAAVTTGMWMNNKLKEHTSIIRFRFDKNNHPVSNSLVFV